MQVPMRLDGFRITRFHFRRDRTVGDSQVRLNEVSVPPLAYPYWHQNWSVYDRMSPADLAYHDNYPRP